MGKGGGNGGGAAPVDPGLQAQFNDQARYNNEMGFRNEAQRNAQYGAFEQAGANIYSNTPWYQQQVGNAANTITGMAQNNIGLADQRQGRELNTLAPFQNTAQNVANTGNAALGPQVDYAMQQLGYAPQYTSQGYINPQAQAGQQTLNASQAVGNQLDPLRGQALSTLSAASQGQISPQIQQLFTDAGGTRERDLLELQTQQARNKIMSTSGSAGGAMDRNLAALEAQRVYGLGQQEASRTNAQRQLASQMFGQATEQGLTAPAQQAALATQAGGLFGSAEQQRQAGLTGALGAVETAASRELAGRSFQQQALVQGQQLAQQLGAQYGQGADALRLAAPEQLGQASALYNQQLMAPSLGASVLGQGPRDSAASYLGPTLGSLGGVIGGNQAAASAAQQSASAQSTSNTQQAAQLAATVGTVALMAFT
jgi:hypothetical protein